MKKRQLLAAYRQLPNWKIVMELGRRALDHHGLSDWSFEVRPINHKGVYTRREIVCGELDAYASFSHDQIVLDWQLLREDEDYILETLHHEIAHALVKPFMGHGARWQKEARRLGVSERNIEWSVECDRKRKSRARKRSSKATTR